MLHAVILVSFDIDGTLEIGDPPGPLTSAAMHLAVPPGVVRPTRPADAQARTSTAEEGN